MYFKSLSLTALGLAVLITGQFTVNAEPASDIAIPHGDLADSYLEIFAADETEDDDFDLSEEFADESTHLVKRGQSCSKYHTVKGSDTCISISKKYGISLSNFYSWNSQIKSGCPNLNNGKKYCVKMSSSSSGSSSSSSSCSKTHKVTNSDNCVKLAKKYGLSLSAFYKLNPSVHSSCDNLDTGKNYCVKAGSGSSSVVKKASKKTTKKSSSKKETRKKLQTKSTFTYYWIAQEGDYSGGKSVSVKTCGGKSIGSVPENYADALVMEGTGVIGSKIVNLGGCSCSGYKCFELVNRKTDPYGLTSFGSPLRPYITIASNDIKKNTKIYVPSLVGWSIPGSSKKHNGCLLADDQSWSFKNHHIDFYVYSMDNYEKLDKAHHTTKVDIYEGGSCKLLNYL